MLCTYCQAAMRQTDHFVYREEADPFLTVHYNEWEYTCPECGANVYTGDNLSQKYPYWVRGDRF